MATIRLGSRTEAIEVYFFAVIFSLSCINRRCELNSLVRLSF